MRKQLRTKDILLLGLSGLLDLWEDVADAGGLMSFSYGQVYGFVPRKYKKHHFAHLLWRNLRTGEIEKVVKNEQIYLRLTSKGEKKIKRDFPLLTFQRKKWDKRWRVVFYDIAEVSRKVRNMLREKLRELGFRMVQRSVWISPHDIAVDFREFVISKGLQEVVFVLETPHFLAGDPKKLVQRVWKIDKLDKEYRRIDEEIESCRRYLTLIDDRQSKREARSTKTMRAKYKKRVRRLKNWYLQVLLSDPFLPKELLPDGWMGERVRREIKRLGKWGNTQGVVSITP